MGVQLLDEVEAYVESSVCRRKFVLHYFGEEYNVEECNAMCDNCRNPKPLEEASQDLVLALNSILALNQNFRIKQISEFLCGVKTKDILDYDLDIHEYFGQGESKGNLFWFSLLRQGILQGYILKDIETYGILLVSDKGKEFLKKPEKFYVSINHDYSTTDAYSDEDSAQTQGAALNQN